MHLALLISLLFILIPSVHAEPTDLSFERSVHLGDIQGHGTVVAMEIIAAESGHVTIEHAGGRLQWHETWITVNPPVAGTVSMADDDGNRETTLDPGSVTLTPYQGDRNLVFFPRASTNLDFQAVGGELRPSTKTLVKDVETQTRPSGGTLSADVTGTSLWSPDDGGLSTIQGDLWLSIYGWNITLPGEVVPTGEYEGTQAGGIKAPTSSQGWLYLRDATVTMEVRSPEFQRVYLSDVELVTDGITEFYGLPTQQSQRVSGVTTLDVASAGDHLQATLTQSPSGAASPSITSIVAPRGMTWLWGGLAAAVLVAAFGVVALASTSIAQLESRTYMALDHHHPRLAAFWGSLWTRRDPWDGHAWSARGEARLLMHHDRGAARDFESAQMRLPPDERAINAFHAARAFARLRRGTETAHWIGIVASLDMTVLLAAREEPDFARVWDHAAVQQVIQGTLGTGA